MAAPQSILFESLLLHDTTRRSEGSSLSTLPNSAPLTAVPGGCHLQGHVAVNADGSCLAVIPPGQAFVQLFTAANDFKAPAAAFDPSLGTEAQAKEHACQLCWLPDGQRLALACTSGKVYLVDRLGQLLREWPVAPGQGGMLGLAAVDDLSVLVLLASSKLVARSVHDDSERQLLSLKEHHREVRCLGGSANLSLVAVVGDSGAGQTGTPLSEHQAAGTVTVSLWRLSYGQPPQLVASTGRPRAGNWFGGRSKPSAGWTVALSPSGRYAAVTAPGRPLLIFTWQDGSNKLSLEPASAQSGQAVANGGGLALDNASRAPAGSDWWSNRALAVVGVHGGVAVVPPFSRDNLLGSCPQQFAPGASLACLRSSYADQPSRIFVAEPVMAGAPGASSQQASFKQAPQKWRRGPFGLLPGGDAVAPPQQVGWRLISLVQRTPQQKMQQHIRLQQWDVALQLAQMHGLDTDDVYRARWAACDMSQTSINENLVAMHDQRAASQLCLSRTARDAAGQRDLLHYALDETSRQCEACAGSQEAAWWQCQRLRVLQHLDRLETLCAHYGSFDAAAYTEFRDCVTTEAAMAFARMGEVQSLATMLTRHPFTLAPNLLAILDSVPETVPPSAFLQLLPEGKEQEPVLLREPDWVETRQMCQQLQAEGEFGLLIATEVMAQLYLGWSPPSAHQVLRWCAKRARAVDAASGQLAAAQALLQGAAKRGGDPEVEELLARLQELCEATQTGSSSGSAWLMSLDQYAALDGVARLRLVMQGSRLDSLPADLSRLAAMLRTLAPAARKSLLVALLEEEVPGRLAWCSALIQAESLHPQVFGEPSLLAEAAVACVYAWPHCSHFSTLYSILDAARAASRIPHMAQPAVASTDGWEDELDLSLGRQFEDDVPRAEMKELVQARQHVWGAQLLAGLGLPTLPADLRDCSQERAIVLVRTLLARLSRAEAQVSDARWTEVWRQLKELQECALPFLPRQDILAELCRALLRCGHFRVAKGYLTGSGSTPLPPDLAEQIVLAAGREYFYSANSLTGPEISAAKQCLAVLPESTAARAELDTIAAVLKLQDYGITVLPMQFRQIADRMEIMEQLLQAHPDAYTDIVAVEGLAALLGIANRPLELRACLAQAAFKAHDLPAARQLCLELAHGGHAPAWQLAAQLVASALPRSASPLGSPAHSPGGPHQQADAANLGSLDLPGLRQLLGFAMAHCPDEQISDFLGTWRVIEDLSRVQSGSASAAAYDPADLPSHNLRNLLASCLSQPPTPLPGSLSPDTQATGWEDQTNILPTLGDAALAVGCLLALGLEAQAALDECLANSGCGFAQSQRALLLGMFVSAVQALTPAGCEDNQLSASVAAAEARLASFPWQLAQKCAALRLSPGSRAQQAQQHCQRYQRQLVAAGDASRLRAWLPDVDIGLFTSELAEDAPRYRLAMACQVAAVAGRLGPGARSEGMLAEVVQVAGRYAVDTWQVKLQYVVALLASWQHEAEQVAALVDLHKAELLQQPSQLQQALEREVLPQLRGAHEHVAFCLGLLADCQQALQGVTASGRLVPAVALLTKLQHFVQQSNDVAPDLDLKPFLDPLLASLHSEERTEVNANGDLAVQEAAVMREIRAHVTHHNVQELAPLLQSLPWAAVGGRRPADGQHQSVPAERLLSSAAYAALICKAVAGSLPQPDQDKSKEQPEQLIGEDSAAAAFAKCEAYLPSMHWVHQAGVVSYLALGGAHPLLPGEPTVCLQSGALRLHILQTGSQALQHWLDSSAAQASLEHHQASVKGARPSRNGDENGILSPEPAEGLSSSATSAIQDILDWFMRVRADLAAVERVRETSQLGPKQLSIVEQALVTPSGRSEQLQGALQQLAASGCPVQHLLHVSATLLASLSLADTSHKARQNVRQPQAPRASPEVSEEAAGLVKAALHAALCNCLASISSEHDAASSTAAAAATAAEAEAEASPPAAQPPATQRLFGITQCLADTPDARQLLPSQPYSQLLAGLRENAWQQLQDYVNQQQPSSAQSFGPAHVQVLEIIHALQSPDLPPAGPVPGGHSAGTCRAVVTWPGWQPASSAAQHASSHKALLLGRTMLLLRPLWPGFAADPADVDSLATAEDLFMRLLQDTSGPKQPQALRGLLADVWSNGAAWPGEAGMVDGDIGGVPPAAGASAPHPAGACPLHRCWLALLQKMLQLGETEPVLQILDFASQQRTDGQQPNERSYLLTEVEAEQLLQWDTDQSIRIAMGLLVPYGGVRTRALDDLRSPHLPSSFQVDRHLLTTILLQDLLPSLVNTPVFARICEALFRTGSQHLLPPTAGPVDSQSCLVPAAIASLVENGHYMSAAALAMQHTGLHPALASLDGGLALLRPCLQGYVRAYEQIPEQSGTGGAAIEAAGGASLPVKAGQLWRMLSEQTRRGLQRLTADMPYDAS